jgi:riboflavin synthase
MEHRKWHVYWLCIRLTHVDSLTLTSVSDTDRTFGVMLIAHTRTKVTLAEKLIGGTVNIEVDMLGKYVEKAVIASFGGDSEIPGSAGEGLRSLIEKVVEKTLREKGI